MKLTKQQAIEEHRKMWNYIADQLESGRKDIIDIYILKREYISKEKNDAYILNRCFCCEYNAKSIIDFDEYNEHSCSYCPLLWGTEDIYRKYNDNCYCESDMDYQETLKIDSMWNEANDWAMNGNYKEAARRARIIANLPERPNNKHDILE